MNQNSVYHLYATAAFGLEGLVASELKRLKMDRVAAESGGVHFLGTMEDAFLCNIRLRFCDRVYLIIAQYVCLSFDELFRFVRTVPWETFMKGDEAINISAKCVKSKLMSPRDCQSISKKAIIERLKEKTKRDIFPESGVPFPVHISVRNNQVSILLDTTGAGLSRRGYRTWNGEAPIRETLASALVEMSPWRPGMPLYDPCCGTGTILIEAALREIHRAPGLYRNFALEGFSFCSEFSFDRIRNSEKAAILADRHTIICGSDIDPAAIVLAKRHIVQASLDGKIDVETKALQQVQRIEEHGVFICNPPYGERLSDRQKCHVLYADLHRLHLRHPGWSFCAISSDPEFERYYGKKADRKKRLYNGTFECNFYIYEG